jgi:hypothetical protein
LEYAAQPGQQVGILNFPLTQRIRSPERQTLIIQVLNFGYFSDWYNARHPLKDPLLAAWSMFARLSE